MKKSSIVFCTLLLSHVSGAQSEKFVVIQFVQKHSISMHEPRTYTWIVEKDSIRSYSFVLSKLLVESASLTDIANCKAGLPVDPELVTDKTVFYPGVEFENVQKALSSALTNRRLVQTIQKKWEGGQKETVSVYCTAIEGTFCHSAYDELGHSRGYFGDIFIPISTIRADHNFWGTQSATFVKNRDYSDFAFDVLPWR